MRPLGQGVDYCPSNVQRLPCLSWLVNPAEVGDPSYPYEQTSTGSSACLYVYRGLDFILCHYLAQHICREQEHIQVPYSVESDLAALTTEAKERSKIRPKSRRFSRRNKRRPVARPSPSKIFLAKRGSTVARLSIAPLYSIGY